MSESGSTSSRARSRSPAATSPSSCSHGGRRVRTLTWRPARRIRSLRRWRRRPSCSTTRSHRACAGRTRSTTRTGSASSAGRRPSQGRSRYAAARGCRASGRRPAGRPRQRGESRSRRRFRTIARSSDRGRRPRVRSSYAIVRPTPRLRSRRRPREQRGVSATYRSFRPRRGLARGAARVRSRHGCDLHRCRRTWTRTSSRCRGAVSLDVRRFRAADRARRGQPSMDHACAGGGRAVRGAARRVGVEDVLVTRR